MVQRKRMKKGLAVLLFFFALFSILGGSLSVSAAGKEKYRSSYMQYVRKQQEKSQKKLFYAIVNASDGKMPVLLIATADSCLKNGAKGAVSAKVYSYSDGKVVYIAKMQSTGSGYPLTQKGKYIISGWHHSSQRLMVSGAKGYMESVDGAGMEIGKGCKKTWTVVNGKKQKLVSKKISIKKASLLYFYSNDNEKNTIKFKTLN